MLKKNIRLRKEYLFNREHEKKHLDEHTKKQQVKNAMESKSLTKAAKKFLQSYMTRKLL